MLIASVQSQILAGLKSVCGAGACGPASLTGIVGSIANVLIFLVGAASVIMIIVAGLSYVVSGGNSDQVVKAKNTILYAVIGIIVSISSYAIANFVITSVK